MTQLSPHFTLAEFTDSQTATRLNILNIPPPAIIEKLKRTAGKMEQVRYLLGDYPIITSGPAYRCEMLERVLCDGAFKTWCKFRSLAPTEANWRIYFATKQHPKGEAVDFKCPKFGSPEKIIQAIRLKPLGFDQLILEYPGEGGWVHASFSDKPRGQVLVIDRTGTHNF